MAWEIIRPLPDPADGSPGQVVKINAAGDGWEIGSVDTMISPVRWGVDIGTKYGIVFGDENMDETYQRPNGLVDAGWTLSGGKSSTVGGSGDFLDAADPGRGCALDLSAAGNLIVSPVIFGAYWHALAAKQVLGAFPAGLRLSVYAQFTTVANNEKGTCFGMFRDQSDGSQAISIHSDGTNFRLRMESTGTEDAGAAVDTDAHLFAIEVRANSTEWFIDGVSQGVIAEDADDQWPVGLGALITPSTGANDITLFWASLEYLVA